MFLHGFTIIYFTIGCTTKDYKHSQTLYLKNYLTSHLKFEHL